MYLLNGSFWFKSCKTLCCNVLFCEMKRTNVLCTICFYNMCSAQSVFCTICFLRIQMHQVMLLFSAHYALSNASVFCTFKCSNIVFVLCSAHSKSSKCIFFVAAHWKKDVQKIFLFFVSISH